MQDIEIYVHIPFCKRKCLYCDFFSGPFSEAEQEAYFENLIQEIKESPYSDRGFSVSSVFIGGGTPSSVKPSFLERVLREIKVRYQVRKDAEISMECNPGAVASDLKKYREMGINRLSIGLQAAQNDLLKRIGRIHTYEEFLQTYKEARQAGFTNINIDLMSGLPGQTVSDFEKGLKEVVGLKPEHISVYALIIAENTPFYALYGAQEEARERGDYEPQKCMGCGPDGPACLPTEEDDRSMYELTEEILVGEGYHRYEISNYALPGMECKHNLGYWTHVPYLGFGAAAASFMPDSLMEGDCYDYSGKWIRFKNPEKLNYPEGPYEEQETLGMEDLMGEFMMLGLRMIKGVSEHEFRKRFSADISDVFGEPVQRFLREGLLEKTDGFIRLTHRGLDVANMVFEAFI